MARRREDNCIVGRIALDPPSQPVLNPDDDGSLPNLTVDTY
jgi:hypothetical protein